MPFEVIDHTADIGVRATGATFQEALAECVRGFFAIAAPEADIGGDREWVVEVEAASLDELVVDLLDEVNFVHQIDHALAARVVLDADVDGLDEDVPDGDGGRVRVTLIGETYDADRHGYLMDIKATTFHDLRVETDPPLIEVLFDI